LDDEWHGRARSVITKLAEDNVKLKKKLTDLECTITTMKQERLNHRQQMKARDKKELACVVVVVALAIFYALFVMMIRGFV
jgi:type II secretory pathway component PulM